jgi:hypothetical protein
MADHALLGGEGSVIERQVEKAAEIGAERSLTDARRGSPVAVPPPYS